MPKLNENQIIERTADYLKSRGAIIKSLCTTTQRGPDIVAEFNGKILTIEAKGDTSSNPNSNRFATGFSKNQLWSHTSVALMKTLVDMNSPNSADSLFGLALPESHKQIIFWIKTSLGKLGVLVFLVSENGEVYQY